MREREREIGGRVDRAMWHHVLRDSTSVWFHKFITFYPLFAVSVVSTMLYVSGTDGPLLFLGVSAWLSHPHQVQAAYTWPSLCPEQHRWRSFSTKESQEDAERERELPLHNLKMTELVMDETIWCSDDHVRNLKLSWTMIKKASKTTGGS